MPKIMVVNVTHSEESRVGVLKDGVLEAFEIEALSREHLKGNIYKGVIRRIHPALEAAFVDIGADRDAFLPLDEICFRNLPHPTSPTNADRRRRRVRDLLRPGEEILVQIVKEQFGSKPPTLTTFYSLPGRYLVLLPGSDDAGISRQIEGDERLRIRKLIDELKPPEGFGIIVRTAAGFDQDSGELSRDLSYLQRLWENVRHSGENRRAPALVYREHDLVLRTIRDYFTPDIDEIHIDNEDVYQRARDFLHNVMPGKEAVLRLYTNEQPIFSAFGIESQIESIFKRRVNLRSGGSIVIDTAEALTAIDVNSGGSVRGSNPEETAFRTNLEACREVARQLRLRDIGGIIVVDFIDMREPEHIHEVERAMREAMRLDKARHETGRISRLGLMEISRQRLRPAAMATTYTSCPMCEGHGAIRTTESAALVALRKLHNRVALGDVASMKVALPAEVALYLLNQKRDDLAQLEERYSARIQVNLSDRLMPHQMELEVKVRHEAEVARERLAPGTVAEPAAPAARGNGQGAEVQNGNAAEASGKKRRRRRGGRRGRARRAAVAIGEALAALGAGAQQGAGERADQPSMSVGIEGTAQQQTPEEEHPGAGVIGAELQASARSTESQEGSVSPRPTNEGSGRSGRRRRGGRGRRRGRLATAPQPPSGPVMEATPHPSSQAESAATSRTMEIAGAEPVPAKLPPMPSEDSPAPGRRSSSRRRPTKTGVFQDSPTEQAAPPASGSRKRAAKATPQKTAARSQSRRRPSTAANRKQQASERNRPDSDG